LAKRGTRDINPVDRGLFKTIQQGEIDMARYRGRLPQLDGQLFLTDCGIETTLIFHDRLDLPFFAAFDLLKGAEGTAALKRYFSSHAGISRDAGVGFIFESATWRASPDWGTKLGYSAAAVDTANRKAIDVLVELRDALETEGSPMVISGCVGPRGDGYNPDALVTADKAKPITPSRSGRSPKPRPIRSRP
jgi:S-methylmethionine-dependent homocysteine/selenocysteine methylase